MSIVSLWQESRICRSGYTLLSLARQLKHQQEPILGKTDATSSSIGEVRFMRQALRLAARGVASASPVGAVIVKDAKVIGRGYHARAGAPHAEIVALQQAGGAARGADLYVTLEPCSHFGRTAPCVDAVITVGIARVFVGCVDPNPQVAGQGLARLRAAGVEVYEGHCKDEACEFNLPHRKFITTGLPLVTLKLACSLDGKIATHTGASKWITGEAARKFAHQLRAQHRAIVVGVNTIITDDPSLTTRLGNKNVPHYQQPLRVVVDSRGRTSEMARFLRVDSSDKTRLPVIATTAQITDDKRAALATAGAEILVLPDRQGRVSLEHLLAALAARNITSVLVEGGGKLAAGFLEAGLVDRVWFIIAPLIIGGAGAPAAVAGDGVASLAEAWRLDKVQVKRLGADVAIGGYIRGSMLL
jgi:diaminohydroxyphosphoribosylaminopyrimidine deaminase / 5-amino-6-(5-phosphoribosylamino)uracil reductase